MNALRTFRRGRRFWLAGATLVAVAVFGAVAVATSGAAGPCPIPGNFEIDGNMTQQTCTPGADDWNTPNIGVVGTNQGGTYSTSGKDGSDPSTWTSTGSTPNKTDFSQAYATSRTVDVGGSPHFFVFVAWERTSTTGTQGYAVELTNAGANVASDGTPQPNRSKGGSVFYISATGGSAPSFDSSCTYTSQSDYGSTCSNSSAGFYSAFNSAPFTDPLSGQSIAAGGFYEVALDVTALTGIVPSCPGATAATVYLRSITGQTKNGNLKGYMAPLEVAPDSTCVPPPISTTATPGGSQAAIGSSQHDTVTVGTQQVPGSGSVKFFLCSPTDVSANGGDCSKNGTQVGSAVTLVNGQGSSGTVNAGSTPNDNAVGKYCWRAEFTPDSNDHHYLPGSDTNSLATGAAGDECFIVVPNSPSIATSLKSNPIQVDGSTKDSATLSSATSNAGGTVDYRYYASQADCQTDASAFPGTAPSGGTDVGSVTVTDGSVPDSASVTFHNASTYYFAAFYSGDTNNNPAVSDCSTELLVVNKANPSIATKLGSSSISVDGSTNDSATLSNASLNAGGTVDYRYYGSQAACQTDASAFPGTPPSGGTNVGSVTVTNGSVPNSASVTFHNAGNYYFAAFYSGDSNNQAAVSDCASELLVVNKATPSIATKLASSSIAVDGSTNDSATLSNASGNAGGTVDYRFYGSQAACETDAAAFPGTSPSGGTDVGSVTVSGGSVPDSAAVTFHNAGTYYFAAFYSGDSNNVGAASDCSTEVLVVNKATPSITTKLASSSIAVDGSTHDSATLSSASANAGGSVDYRFYASQADCQTDANAFPGTSPSGGTDVGSVTVTGGSVPDSAAVTFHNAGTYYFAAFYSGDSNNVGAASDCSTEVLVVNKATPSITTKLASSSIAVDGSTHDSATLSSASANAGGSVDYRFYGSQAACETDASAFPGTSPSGGTDVGSVTVSGGSVPDSASVTFHNAGTYYFAAFYSGDSNNVGAASDCSTEVLVVNKATPSIATKLADSSIPVDGSTNDSATLSNASGNAGGSVDYRFYASQADCQTDANAFPGTAPSGGTNVGSVTVTNGSVPDSASVTFHNTGTYYFAAFYSGDSNNVGAASDCSTELLVVNKAQPSIATKLASSAIGVDGSTNDSATLSNASQNAGGTVDYRFYGSQAACEVDAAAFPGTAPSGGTDVGSVTVTNGLVPDSASVTFHNTGTYYFAAFYSGDSNNVGAASDCSTELLVVSNAVPTIATKLANSSIAVDGSTNDSATLSNASLSAGGTVDYRFYASQADCETDAAAFPGTAPSGGTDVGSVPVVAGVVPDSASVTFHNAGTYYFAAFYSGDSNNAPAVSDCSTELLVVNQAQPSIATKLAKSTIAVDGSTNDSATLSGASLNAGGTVDYRFYSSQADCETDAAAFPGTAPSGGTDVGSVTVTNGSVPDSAAVTFHNAGNYYFAAFYSGDSNNAAAASDCSTELLVVNKAQPSIATKLAHSSIAVDGSTNDSATLSGASQNAGGSVDYRFYSSQAACETDAAAFPGTAPSGGTDVGSVTVTDGLVPDSASVTFHNAGTYYFAAFYSGDANNAAAASDCSTELLVVNQATPSIATRLANSEIGVDGSTNDSATLSNASLNAGGTVDYRYYASQADCQTDASAFPGTAPSGGTDVGSVPVVAGVVPDSPSVTFHNAGTYYFAAFYSGDANNAAAVSDCSTELLVVDKAQPSLTTTQDPATGSVGDTYKDKATLTGSLEQDGTGSIRFDLYNNPDCSGDPLHSETVPVDANGTFETPNGVTLNTAGSYYWVASFSGDSNNLPAQSGCADEKVVVQPASIQIVKTPDAAKVNAGSPIGFTLTVFNTGDGAAHGVKLSDTLPTNSGLSWTIASQGSGWGGSCSIAAGVLNCGPATVPGGTTQTASTFTVHITSPTTGATGGDCPGSGTVNNTGSVTTTNDGSGQSSASTCVQALVDLSITKSGSPATQDLGQGNITWTIVVTNNGPSADTGVTITDPMPAGNTFVSATSTKGTCTGGAILTCNIGDMAAGESVTITLVTTPTVAGAQTNTATVSGNRPETNTGNNQASATVQVNTFIPPPVVYCVAVSKVTPTQLFVGRKTGLTIHVTQHNQAKAGVRVLIRGPKVLIRTKPSNAKGVIKQTVKMKKAGALIFSPIASKRCNTKRIGVTNVFTPPVTG